MITKKNNFKKWFVSLIAVLSISIAIPGSTFAATYSFKLTPPLAGSAKSTPSVKVNRLNSAYVKPRHSATPTSYVLTTDSARVNVTSVIPNVSTTGTRSFSYFSNHGGVGNRYSLTAYPSNYAFVEYNVAGEWSP